jgi:chromosome segregation ATPase
MKIKSLALKDFRSHASTQLGFEPLTVIRGMNGSGKSSIAQAIEFTLTGRCEGTDEAGRGSEYLIRQGAKEFSIQIDLEGFSVCATKNAAGVTRKVLVDGKTLTGKDAAAEIARRLASSDVLSAMLRSGKFLELPANDQKELLASVLLPANATLPDSLTSLLTEASISDAPGLQLDARLKAIHEAAYKERTVENRMLRDSKASEEPRLPEGIPSREAVETKLKGLQTELAVATKALGVVNGEYDKSLAIYNERSKRLRDLENAVEREKLTYSSYEAQLLSDALVKDLKKTVKNAAKAKKLDTDIQRLMVELEAAKNSINAIQALEAAPECPTCKQTITEDMLKAMYEPLVEASDKLHRALTAAQDERSKMTDPSFAQKRLEDHEAAAKHVETIAASLAAAQKEVEACQAELGVEPSLPDTESTEQAIATTRARIEKGQTILADVAGYEQKLKQWKQIDQQRQSSQKRVETLEKILDLAGPNGLGATLVASHSAAFQDSVNRVLNAWGYEAEFCFEPYKILIQSLGDGRKLLLSQMSESQQYRFCVALQVALAVTTGLGFVVIDRADILDPQGRRQLTQALRSGQLDQAIMLATGENMVAPEMAGTAFYYLVEGDAGTRLESAA